MEPLEIAPGLYRWEAPHPQWKPQEGWPQLVGCVLYELDERAVLIDPLIPAEARQEFLAWLDGRLEGRQVSVLTTIRWHGRDRDELAGRYCGDDVEPGSARARSGVSPRRLKGAGEIVFWLPGAAALVPGTALSAGRAGGCGCVPRAGSRT